MGSNRYPVAYKEQRATGSGDFQSRESREVVEMLDNEPWEFSNVLKARGRALGSAITPQEFRDLVSYDGQPDLEMIRLEFLRKQAAELARKRAWVKAGILNAERFGRPSVYFLDWTDKPHQDWDARLAAWEDWLTPSFAGPNFYPHHDRLPGIGRGGNFGGGGATDTWGWPDGMFTYGDARCSFGNKDAWVVFENFLGVDGPASGHANGTYSLFYGYEQAFHNFEGIFRAGWLPTDNHVGVGAAAQQPFTKGFPPDCSTNGTGYCALPDVSLQSFGDEFAERYAKATIHHSDAFFDYREVNTGDIWCVGSIPCIDRRVGFGRKRAIKGPSWRKAKAPPGTEPDDENKVEDKRRAMERGWPDLEFTVPGTPVAPGRRLPGGGGGGPPAPPPRTRPNSDRKIKVGKRTKEYKFTLRGALGRVWIAANVFTEGEDFIKAMHAALPKKCQAKRWQPDGSRTQARHMLKPLWQCGSAISVAKAMENLINNEIADWYYGIVIGRTGKAINQKFQLPTGGTRAFGAAVGKSLPRPPKVELEDKGVGQWWLDI